MIPPATSQLERAWAVLSLPSGTEIASFPLDIVFDGRPCRVALDATGARHLLVPAGKEAVATDPRPAVLGLAVRKLSFGGLSETFVDVSCAEADLFPEFDEVVADVLESAVTSNRPGAATVRTVGRWRRLFKNRLLRGLSHEAKLGLFAELCVLGALVDADPNFPVTAWRGPLREPHDFEAPMRCLEVKALGATSESITVHGIEQMASHDNRPLDLLLLRVVDDPDGRTLDDVVEEVRVKVSSKADFRGRLASARWVPNPGEDKQRFAVQESLRVIVGDAVPRIVPKMLVSTALAEGVRDLRYEIELGSLLMHADSATLAAAASEAVR